MTSRRPRTARADETGRHEVLYPAIAEAAHRLGADAIGLIDVGRPAGFNLHVDRVGITYVNGPSLGDPSSPLQLSPTIVHRRPVPERSMPPVVARIVVARAPLDLTDSDDLRRLRACLPLDQPECQARLDAELALAAAATPARLLLGGDPVALLPDAIARVPADALPVFTTTWALSAVTVERRARFLRRLEETGSARPLAWVSVEGVGVAPTIPTLGDRPASGHSLIGLAAFTPAALAAPPETVGRCWSRGRLLEWLADHPEVDPDA